MSADRLITQAPGPDLTADELALVQRAAAIVVGELDELASWLLREAGEISTEMKHDGTLVTAADLAVSTRLTALLAEHFPEHAVISEEASTAFAGARWTWVIDPIDGTSNFAAGLPNWCISVALCRDGWPVLGIVDVPAQHRRYEAILGAGAVCTRWLRDGSAITSPMRVWEGHELTNPDHRHAPIFITTGTLRRARGKLAVKARILGAAAHDLALVANGDGVGSVGRVPKVWDVAAGTLLVREAGGTIVMADAALFPLVAGQDYGTRAVFTVAGASRPWIDAFIDGGELL